MIMHGMGTELFKAVDVWQRRSDTELVRYRCFQSLRTEKYSVQSEDHYHSPLDAKQTANLDRQFLELMFEMPPSERSGEYDSLSEAITAHIQSFADFWFEERGTTEN